MTLALPGRRASIRQAGLMTIFTVLLALPASVPVAAGTEFSILAAEPVGQFMVFGRIYDGFEAAMRQAIARNPQLKRVYIESPGGLTLEARRTARLLNEHGMSIRVGGKCASACAGLWAATDRRELTASARLGLHALRAKKRAPGVLEDIASMAREKIADDMLRHAGFSEGLIARGNRIPHSSVLWLTPAELADDGVRFVLVGKPHGDG